MRSQHFSANRWLIFAPVAILALFAPSANAEPIAGLQATYYVIDEIPPTRSDDIYTVCGSEVENNINRSYDGEPYLDCTNDLFMVHMTGFITIPEHDTIEFWLASDDGGIINIDGNEWGNWGDQGCSATESGQIDISAGSQSLELFMYENGGGTCLMLAWNIDGQGFQIVPDEAFITMGIPTDTTIPDTTIPDTTTTIQETTTTWESTTTSTTSTTTTTTSTIAPSTTVLVTPNLTTTTLQTTTTSLTEVQIPQVPLDTTTSSSPFIYLPQLPTIDLPVITQPMELPPVETFMPTPDSVPTEINDAVIPIPLETILPVLEPLLPIELPATLGPVLSPLSPILPLDPVFEPVDTIFDAPVSSETRVTDLSDVVAPEVLEALSIAGDSDIPLTAEQFDSAISAISNLTDEQTVALVEQILSTAVTADQAEQLAVSPEILAVVTSDQAEQIFEVLDVSQLDDSQKDELVAAVQDAPTTARKAFEKKINIFSAGFDNYVPTGSSVPVSTRRSLIAIGAGVCLVSASPTRVRR